MGVRWGVGPVKTNMKKEIEKERRKEKAKSMDSFWLPSASACKPMPDAFCCGKMHIGNLTGLQYKNKKKE